MLTVPREVASRCDDSEYLRTVQYADESNLAARQSIYAFEHPRIDLAAAVINAAAPSGREVLADQAARRPRHRHFGSVTRHDFAGELRIPDPRPVADYVRSMGITPDRADLDRLVSAVLGLVQFGTDGSFTVTAHAGCLICA